MKLLLFLVITFTVGTLAIELAIGLIKMTIGLSLMITGAAAYCCAVVIETIVSLWRTAWGRE